MKRSLALVLLLVLSCGLLLTACGGGGETRGDQMSLYILNWGDYIDEDKLEEFRAGHPEIDVHYETMTSNEEMLVQLQSPNCIYDVCFPSDYTITKLLKLDLLQKLDLSKLSNYDNTDPRFLSLEFDPDNEYSVPYMWGTVGILYNKTMVQEPVDSWSILWDERYSKQILMYDSVRDSMAVALKKLGYSLNTTNKDEIAAAEAELTAQKPLVLAYGTDDLRDKMINGNAALAVVYSGDAIAAIAENPDLDYVVPMEGSNIWFDNVVLTKSSKNVEAAHIFIDWLLDAEVAAANTEWIGYSSPNRAAMEIIPAEMRDDPIYNPAQDVIDRCEAFIDLGDAMKDYNDAWLRIKAAQ